MKWLKLSGKDGDHLSKAINLYKTIEILKGEYVKGGSRNWRNSYQRHFAINYKWGNVMAGGNAINLAEQIQCGGR